MRLSAGVVVVGVCLAACGDGDSDVDTPVPETAVSPFACPGVPLQGAELMSGTDELEVQHNAGVWGAVEMDDQFHCALVTPAGADVSRAVEVRDYGAFAPADVAVEAMRGHDGSQPIRSDQPGEGYVWDFDEALVKAGWVCDDRHLVVDFFHYGRPVDGRDPQTDASRYLASMLPWGCGGEDVPGD